MHFEILVEDISGKRALEILVPKIIPSPHTHKIHPYRGIGRIPKGMRSINDSRKKQLLENLPKLLKGYGMTFASYPSSYRAAVIVVCDLDDRCLKVFRTELVEILEKCIPKPNTKFCFAIEEGEAWFLGDLSAVKSAYPKAREESLKSYSSDSICGTWEKLADAIYPGGSQKLSKKPWFEIGLEKTQWAEQIAPKMDINCNTSPSFCYFRDSLRSFTEADSVV